MSKFLFLIFFMMGCSSSEFDCNKNEDCKEKCEASCELCKCNE